MRREIELPPIVKLAERLLLEIEQAVRRFPRYYKFTVGTDLRRQAMKVAELAHLAWRDRARQVTRISRLSFAIDHLKLRLQLGKQIEAFASFRQFELVAGLAHDLGRQCGGWLKDRRSKGQDAPAEQPPEQRAQILSTRDASIEANA